jgi:hypothetical protein
MNVDMTSHIDGGEEIGGVQEHGGEEICGRRPEELAEGWK